MGKIREILLKNTVINLEEASSILGSEKAVYRFAEKGKIIKVYPDGLGFFSLPGTEEGTAQFAIVAKYYSQCVVSGKTALALYDLSLDYIRQIDVDISNKTNLSNSLLNVHRVVDSKINNVISRSFEDKGISFKIKIYSPERSLFEAYKYYKGSESFYYALKKYKELYLDNSAPGQQFDLILNINKRIGKEIINLLMMGSSSE